MIRLILFLLILVLVPLVGFNLNLTLSYDHVPLLQVRSALLVSLSAFLFSYLMCYLIKRYESVHAKFSHDHDLSGVQKMHSFAVPRVGGLAIFVGLLLSFWLMSISLEATGVRRAYLGYLLLASLPVFSLGLIEDVTKRISPRVRLLAAFVSAALGALFLHAVLKRVDVLWADALIGYWPPLVVLFSLFVVGGTTHSFNLIDGYNGLASGVGLVILGAIGLLAYHLGDQVVLMLSINVFMALLGFLMWNWPRGRIFLGDGGAYLLGFLIVTIMMILLDRNPEVSTWYLFALLGYPTFETIFSIYRRKLFQGERHDVPDDLHLHQLLYRQVVRLRGEKPRSWICNNSMTSVPLWGLMLVFVIVIQQLYDDPQALIWLYVAGVVGYKLTYRLLHWLYLKDAP